MYSPVDVVTHNAILRADLDAYLDRSLGMVHDGYGNNCNRNEIEGKVMASTVQANYEAVHWTECSRRSLEQHIG